MGIENVQTAVRTKKKPSFFEWLKSGKGQKVMVIITFSFFPLLLLLLFTYLPFEKMLEFSFRNMSYTKDRGFVGLDNYKKIVTRSEYFSTLYLSLYYMAGAIVQLVLALYFATILSFKTKCGSFFKGSMFFPFLINGIAIGFIFKFFYTRGYVFDSVLQFIGFDLENLPYWLQNQKINNISLVATSVWKYLGQNMVLFIGAIMSVDSEMYEAAQIDGANKWHQFIYIILPSIKTIVMLNVILSITGSLSAFEPAYVIMGGGANGTATFFVKMHQTAHVDHKVGMASAMAVTLLMIIIFATILQKLLFRYVFNDDEDIDRRRAAKERKYRKREAGNR